MNKPPLDAGKPGLLLAIEWPVPGTNLYDVRDLGIRGEVDAEHDRLLITVSTQETAVALLQRALGIVGLVIED